jgi:hypothetical protein
VKTISVKDAAVALNITQRAVLYRREKGQLKGLLIKNDHGVPEYRIYPNKEIIDGLRRINSPLLANETQAEVVDAETIADSSIYTSAPTFAEADAVQQGVAESGVWSDPARANVPGVAEELWSNLISRFLEKIEEKDQLIGEMRGEIADKDRRLKLLPDLEKQAEHERKAAELKELEALALRKQIDALQAEQEAIAEAQRKIEELERVLAENKRQSEEEIERLRQEKETTALAAKADTDRALQELARLKQPWWKKVFGAPMEIEP